MKALLFLVAIFGFFAAGGREKKILLHPNGKVQYEYEMEGFMLEGRFSCYYESGKLKVKGQFTSNKKTGLWRVWDEKGLLRSERVYTSNLDFEILSQTNPEGEKIHSDPVHSKFDSTIAIPLFTHRFLQSVSKETPGNSEIFSTDGLAGILLSKIQEGSLVGYLDDNFKTQLNAASILCISNNELAAIRVHEEYACLDDGAPVMINNLLTIGLVVKEKGVQKLLAWVPVAELNRNGTLDEQLNKLRDHQYVSQMVQSTIDDPSYKLRNVGSRDNDLQRLKLIEMEAAAILYVIDQRAVAVNVE